MFFCLVFAMSLCASVYTLLKIFKGTLRVLPLITIQTCTHIPTHCKSWINKVKTCLSCDWFGNRSRVVFLDKNEVSPFQKSPWNALCENRILLKNTPFFRTNFKDKFFHQTSQHHHFCTLNSL